MLGTTVIIQLAELLGWSGLYFHVKHKAEMKNLIHGNRPQPTRIPIVDAQLKKLAGHPSKSMALVAGRVTQVTRRVVNTKAFEYVLLGVFNKHSRLHPHTKPKHARVRIP